MPEQETKNEINQNNKNSNKEEQETKTEESVWWFMYLNAVDSYLIAARWTATYLLLLSSL